MIKNKNGFTLIELLVVIAIIGLLSTMAVVSLNVATARARDAQRLSDVKNMSKVLSLAAADDKSQALVAPCNVAGAITSTCVGAQPGTITHEFPKFNDPNGTLACDIVVPDECNYTIRNNASTVENTQILFYLEKKAESLAGDQIHWIDSSGAFDL